MSGCRFDLERSADLETRRNEFHTRRPLDDDRLGARIWRNIRRFASNAAVALALTAGTASMPACSQETQETQRHDVVTRAALTDENGRASFDIHNVRYELNVTDSETGDGVPNMLGILSATDEGGLYMVFDQEENRYPPAMTGVSAEDENTESHVRRSNVVVEIPETICNLPRRLVVGGRSPAELFDERSADQRSVLTTFFKPIEDSEGNARRFTLRQLDDEMRHLIEFAVGSAVSEGAEEGIIKILTASGIKLGTRVTETTNAIGWVLMAMDLCAVSDTLSWASYYRGLCYDDEDRFEIWELKNFPEVGWDISGVYVGIITNPVFIILPVERPDEWEAPIAHIDGMIDISETASFLMRRTATLEHVDGILPTVGYLFSGSSNRFFFDAGACENINPEYNLTVNVQDLQYLFAAELSTSLHVSDDEEYEIGFYPAEGCESEDDYFTSYLLEDEICSPYDIAVSCSAVNGYVTAEECNIEEEPEESCFTLITTEPATSPHIYDIDGDILVFEVDNRFRYANIETHEISQLPNGEDEDCVGVEGARVSGQDIITGCWRCGADICHYRIGDEFLTPLPLIETNGAGAMDINEGAIIYEAYTGTDYHHALMSYNIETGEINEIALPIDTYGIGQLVFDGSTLAIKTGMPNISLWYQQMGGDWNQIESFAENLESGDSTQFVMSEGTVAYDIWHGSLPGQIYLYDMNTGSTTTPTALSDYELGSGISLWENRMVFRLWNDSNIQMLDMSTNSVDEIVQVSGWVGQLILNGNNLIHVTLSSNGSIHVCNVDRLINEY
ncbi:hypothetical protein KKF81_04610 [Candidatus Micrarchaeota archaeon]|nr:hypothetical protein [Candidatus Micrarchaeota archaeon]MBU1166208.1 hypothetical protein [Candidatus Micrarchaeota archaeon]MBU1886950.1 hypothetical protein [Candidatus Micrarchaeota archaeon]